MCRFGGTYTMAETEIEKCKIELACPYCGHKNHKGLSWLRGHDKTVCAGCGANFTLDYEQICRAVTEADEALAHFRRHLGCR